MGKVCSPREGLNRGAWTSEEDKLLSDYIMAHGLGKWRSLPANAGLNRCAKSCRLRWMNYLRPDIKRGNITEEEEDLIIRLHNLLGNRWSLIAGRLPGRTDNEIKNYWNTYLRKKGLASSSNPPSKSKKVHSVEANVIRTKAVRCTRALFTDMVPPSAALEQDTFSDFMGHGPSPQGANTIYSAESMQDLVFAQPADSTNNTQNFQDRFSATASSNGYNYTGICDSEFEDGEGLHPFMYCDAWVSVMMPPDIYEFQYP
ncbi:hypothetical protein Cni_G01401 [Canna indica]|uniref:Uncharacterized protein n=1 Tax=Canna indica TaxID=4628 RepID=A0AAQ3Q0Y6_9LILI|nr:hypothetical protein Cni_G01401 [Canna indica]